MRGLLNENDHALEILIAACDSLARRFEDFASSPDRGQPWPEPIRRASALIEDALRSIQRHELGVPSALPSPAGTTVSRLANRLLGGDPAERRVAPEELSEGLRGYSWAISIPDILGFLKIQSKTGLLTVTLGMEIVTIELEQGELVHAISDNAPLEARLGEILVRQGALSRGHFESFLVHSAPATTKRLGELLEAKGLVTREQLRRALETQVQSLFHRLFEAQNACFTFVEGKPAESDGRIRMDVTSLLLESARHKDEADFLPHGSGAA